MAKIDFFTIHIETEEEWISTNIELNFRCDDHVTIIECDGVSDTTNLYNLLKTLKDFFENDIECAWRVEQYGDNYRHKVSIYCDEKSPAYSFECDAIKITEHDD